MSQWWCLSAGGVIVVVAVSASAAPHRGKHAHQIDQVRSRPPSRAFQMDALADPAVAPRVTMRSVEVRLLTDAVEFKDIAESWLSSDPFSTSVLAGMLTGILSGARDQPAGTRWIVVLDDADVVGVAMHTPPYHPFLPRLPAAAAAAVAPVLLATGQEFTGVTGEAAAVTAFADSWAARTGGTSSVAMSMRMYRLGMLTPPVGIPGRPRRVKLSDVELVADWFDRFHTEANPHSPAEDATIAATRRIATDQVWMWEREDRPVSLAVGTMPIGGVATIAPVYTPPDYRRCGYGAAVTSQATRACLDAGARHVTLYTDLANPTSNSIYQRIGYLPDHEAQERQLQPSTATASTARGRRGWVHDHRVAHLHRSPRCSQRGGPTP